MEKIGTAVLRSELWTPILLLALSAIGWQLLRLRHDPVARSQAIGRMGPYLVAAGTYLASLLAVALAHTFDIARYREAAAPLALLTMFAGLFLIVEVLTTPSRALDAALTQS